MSDTAPGCPCKMPNHFIRLLLILMCSGLNEKCDVFIGNEKKSGALCSFFFFLTTQFLHTLSYFHASLRMSENMCKLLRVQMFAVREQETLLTDLHMALCLK